MARTLADQLRRSTPNDCRDRARVEAPHNKRKSSFRQWIEPLFKRAKRALVITIDSSDDEEDVHPVPTPYIQLPSFPQEISAYLPAPGDVAEPTTSDSTEASPEATASMPSASNRRLATRRRVVIVDRPFTGAKGEARCKAQTTKQNQCCNCAVASSDYCDYHQACVNFDDSHTEKKMSGNSSPEEKEDSQDEEPPSVEGQADDNENGDLRLQPSRQRSSMQAEDKKKPTHAVKCIAITLKGFPCKIDAAKNSKWCCRHMAPEMRTHGCEQKCIALDRMHKPCQSNAVANGKFCAQHFHPNNRFFGCTQPYEDEDEVSLEFNQKNHKFFGAPGTYQCTAISLRGYRCVYCATPGRDICYRHSYSKAHQSLHVSQPAVDEKSEEVIHTSTTPRNSTDLEIDDLQSTATEGSGEEEDSQGTVEEDSEQSSDDNMSFGSSTPREEAPVAAKPKRKDQKYFGDAGTKQCIALTTRGSQCMYQAKFGKSRCCLHTTLAKNASKRKQLARSSSKVESVEESACFFDESDIVAGSASSRDEPVIISDPTPGQVTFKDTKWTGGPSSSRCPAISQRGKLCQFASVQGGLYCGVHSIFTPGETIQRPRFHGRSGEVRCKAKTHKGSRCSYQATDQEKTFCALHQSRTILPASLPAAAHTKASSPQPHEDEQEMRNAERTGDVLYNSRRHRTEYRCIFIDNRNQVCRYRAVNDSIYCDRHAHCLDNLVDVSPEAASQSEESSSDSESSSSSTPSTPENENILRPYTHKEFLTMWRECEDFCGEKTDEIENSRRIRGANKQMSPEDTDGQLKAQYGRLLPRATKHLLKNIMCLTKDDVFLDIGHGIGNTCMQAAFTTGCETRGIEVVYGRNSVAEVFCDNLMCQHNGNPHERLVGKIELRHGRLEDEVHQEFLTQGVTRVFANNFNGVFADRSSKTNQKWFLDHYVSGLFALMGPGTIMATLHPLHMGATREEANSKRRRVGLTESRDASFFEVEKVLLGKACHAVKWNQHSGNQQNIYIYKYTRVAQPSGDRAVFLCCNPTCQLAKDAVLLPATKLNEEGRRVINDCICKVSTKNLRRQTRKVYTDF